VRCQVGHRTNINFQTIEFFAEVTLPATREEILSGEASANAQAIALETARSPEVMQISHEFEEWARTVRDG
jgi:hypothetical protein